MNNYDISKDNLNEKMQANIKDAKAIIDFINNNDKALYDSQEVMNWQDDLNAISITYK